MALTRAMTAPAPVAEEARRAAAMAQRLCAALAAPDGDAGLKDFLAQGRAALESLDGQISRSGPAGEDWISVSRAFCRAGEELALAAGDMDRWGVGPERFILRLAKLLAETLLTASEALASCGPTAQSRLAEAKAVGLELQAVFRRARGEALESPAVVDSLKLREVFRRLSEAGAAADKAVEALAWILAGGGRERSGRAH
ncbi:MAG TPA: hypothetical protein VNK24_07780 [Elusimicrobiota bacterium]|nr:hypothetical protein [Elusimicrobiota bacterium]